jgi:hypothetical protein
MSRQTVILLLLFAAVIILVTAGQLFLKRTAVTPAADDNPRSAQVSVSTTQIPTATSLLESTTVSVDYGTGQKISGNVTAKNAFEAVKALAGEKGIPIETKQFKYGFLVTKIGQKESGQGGTWQFYINGKLGIISPGLVTIHVGDKVEWKFEK